MDNGGGSRDGKEGGEKKKGKIAAKLGTNKQRELRRGPGIAKPEAMRIQDEMKRMYLRNHLNQQPPAVSGTGINSLEGNRMATTNPLPSYQQQPYSCRPSFPQQSLSNFVGTVVVSNGQPYYQPAYGRGSVPYTVHPNSSVMAYGTGGGASGYYQLIPLVRLGTSEAASYANPSNMAPTTLSLFKETPDHHKEGKSAYLKKEESHHNQSAGGSTSSKDSNDPHDELDLDLKL